MFCQKLSLPLADLLFEGFSKGVNCAMCGVRKQYVHTVLWAARQSSPKLVIGVAVLVSVALGACFF